MTLVYARDTGGPQTHAIVIGVGRFPYLDGSNAELMEELRKVEPVTSPPNNARAIAAWLIAAADRLVPKLGSVELLVSEKDGSTAQFPRGDHTPPGRQSEDVEAATGDAVETALDDWLARCQTRDDNQGFVYGSSHGMQAQEHILLLEDAGKRASDPWRNMLSLNHLHLNLYRKRHKRNVLIADCCRNLLEEGVLSMDSFSGRRIGNISETEYVKARNEADRFVYLLRASPRGVVAKATPKGLGFLTESLLACFNGGAGEPRPHFGWCISPDRLRSWVEAAGRYGLGIADADLRPVDEDPGWDTTPFLKLEGTPRYPVRVREAEPLDVGRATLTLEHAGNGFHEERAPMIVKPKALSAWVDSSMEPYKASGVIAGIGENAPMQLEPVDVIVYGGGQDAELRRS